MQFASLGAFIGGIGLFLLGMRLMTDGLKLAAGDALRRILGHWTGTPVRGLFSGFLITALVQSSSAVTVATIGFVNAGLLTLAQTVAVIYGSNVGSTMTGWLVALVGFKVDIQAFALPLIGLGALLGLSGGARRSPIGQALAGFGLFFLGIAVLKEAFDGLGNTLPLAQWAGDDLLHLLVFVGVGFGLTLLMQSSAAAMTVTLAAAAGGILPLPAAAATIIGANVGTTSTAAFAVIGATPNARRAAAAHVLFNVITGAAALALLPLLLPILGATAEAGGDGSPITLLALFHTVFNLLGVALLWPFTPALVRFLEGRFRSREEDEGRPRHLDRNVLATPALALDALTLELGRIGAIARTMARGSLSTESIPGQQLAVEKKVVDRLVEAMGQFGAQMLAAHLPSAIVEALPSSLRVARYYETVAELSLRMAEQQTHLPEIHDAILAERMAHFRSDCVRLIEAADPAAADFSREACEQHLAQLESGYQELKAALLRAGASGGLKVRDMVAELDQFSVTRRTMEQVVKAALHLAQLRGLAASFRAENSA